MHLCEFLTFIWSFAQVDFWEHTKSHIKAEKLLSCPKCPFVTEYKHHLEYHLRNHFGSKPFKCPKCSYSCVNKSMLNSHLKSHSNIYQYRCADCSYATKYCHSLKLHLRKYEHSPAMVLNQDGSPNPLPIIDVYGTRRGPKQKSKTADDLEKTDLPGGIVVPAAPSNTASDSSSPMIMGCNLCDFYSPSVEILNQHMYLHAAESPMTQMFRMNNNLPDQAALKDYFHNIFLSIESPNTTGSFASPIESPQVGQDPGSPLDLSKSEPREEKKTDGKKNRRKGKAYKLERVSENRDSASIVADPPSHVKSEDSCSEKYENSKSTEEDDSFKINIPSFQRRSISPEKPVVEDCPAKDDYSCGFCGINFQDLIMYTMHMGYHGYRDPFTCNMCGQETPNRVAFFLHIARSSHT